MARPKPDGGLAFPDPFTYYLASVTSRILDGFHASRSKLWVHLENVLSPLPLTSLPWIRPSYWTVTTRASLPFVAKVVLSVCLHHLPKSELLKPLGPLTPVLNNPDFAPGSSPTGFLLASAQSSLPIVRVLQSSSLMTLSDILGDVTPQPLHSFHYAQLRHFYEKWRVTGDLHRDPTSFEHLCLSNTPPTHTVSLLYSMLNGRPSQDLLPYQRGWIRELDYTPSESEWETSLLLCHKVSRAVAIQETNYKLLSRWYRVPSLLHRYYPSVPDICWRCGQPGGTLVHIWLSCPLLTSFWSSVSSLITEITGARLEMTPQITLLSMLPGSPGPLSKGLTALLLAAARRVIPRRWKSTSPPTTTDWLREVLYIQGLEECLADLNATSDKFLLRWRHWLDFTASTRFLQYGLISAPPPPS